MPREPKGVLGEIVARKRVDVAARLGGVSLDEIRTRAGPTSRSLKSALEQPGARFIMEVKRASPSQGELRAALDPVEVARAYCGVADAISVLTDGPYFGGSFADLAAVRAQVDCPVLCKDFMVDVRQVAEARSHGADAILVMLSVLDDAQAAEMIAEARLFGMEALVEAHTAEEVDRAVTLGAEIVGINNRDLGTLRVDHRTTLALADRVPADRLLVSESGFNHRDQVIEVAPRVDAFLIGSSLMLAPDPGWTARGMIWGHVKVCGLTRVEDVRAARDAGASFGGLIFVAESPRWIDRATADALEEAARDDWRLPLVGVFRDADVNSIVSLAERHQLAAVQLHGLYSDDEIEQLREELPDGCEVWPVFGIGDGVDYVNDRWPLHQRIVYDAFVDGKSGGTGQTFDWSLLEALDLDTDLAVLAGGLNPDNARAADAVGAWALDVNSGVEDAPGIKSPEKLRAFFDALRPLSRKELAQ